MVKRVMNRQMQNFGIGRMLSNTRWNNEMFDISAHVDSTLSFGENKRNIQNILGIQTRDRGLEHMHHQQESRKRAMNLRKDTLRQTGPIQGDIGHRMDMMLHALPPGRRISHTGRRYYERRENRSDRNYTQRL